VIAGIILAAGASSRMGSPKALLTYRGETFIDRLIGSLSAVCDPVIVALGYHAAAVRAGAKRNATFAINPDPDRGQLSSLQSALAAVPEQAEGFMFMPVDCPAAEPETIARIAAAFRNRDRATLVVIPQFDGRHGHPVCASRELISEFLALPPTSQAREVVKRHADRTQYLDVADAGILTDIDDLEAYKKLASG
jgi:molybdenum cofactor cytidylyltransferase